LTPLGESLLEPIGALHHWVLARGDEVDAARAGYDANSA